MCSQEKIEAKDINTYMFIVTLNYFLPARTFMYEATDI